MTKKKHGVTQPAGATRSAETATESGPEPRGAAPDAAAQAGLAPAPPGGPAAGADAAAEAVQRLEAEAAEWKDRCLRSAAELENFKKRVIRERSETWGRAQADLISRMLDVVDDLGRVAALDPAQTTAAALHEGIGLLERKLLKALGEVGLEPVDPTGQAFDPNLHEAVLTVPAPSPEDDQVVQSVFQLGYRLNGTLLRPARVAVYVWTGAPPGEAAQ
jgi:molecular chaperone GrpE